MASILDSFRETFSDRLSILKVVLYSIPVFFAYNFFAAGKGYEIESFWTFWISVILLFGFLVKTTTNVLHQGNNVLPSLNPIPLLFAALKAICAVGPFAAISIFLALWIVPQVHIIEWLDYTLISLIWLIVVAVILTAFLMFVDRERISDAYNLKKLSDKSGDLMVGVVFYVLQLVVINIVTTGFLTYSLFVLFGMGPFLYFFLSMALVFNVGVTGHYMAQLQYEVMGMDANKY